MRYSRPKRNKFRSNDRGFRRNDSQGLRTHGINSTSKNFQKTFFGRNGLKAEKLLEKYNDLAKEALSNGDKILSESYYQHADHFLSVIENRNLHQNNSQTHLDNPPVDSSTNDKIILEDKKNSSSQETPNTEKI